MPSLHDVKDWNDDKWCTVTALCAVSGKSCEQVEEALREEARAQNFELDDLHSVSPKVWLPTLARLGLNAKVVEATPLPIDKFMLWHGLTAVSLAQCANDNPTTTDEQGHVFAFEGARLVDTYTKGKIVTFKDLPEGYPAFYVKHVIKLSDKKD